MRLSTRSRYGLKAVVDIAAHGKEKCVSISSMAGRLGISENYLEQLIIKLKKAGIVESIRGAQGGYILKRPAEEITVREILTVLEGSLYPVECLDEGSACSCGDGSCTPCVTKSVWEKMYRGITDVVDAITVSDLAEDYQLNLR